MHKAGNGDCISIDNESEFVLIDGGTSQSFSNWKSDIFVTDKIDSVIVTHIDSDHVNGVISLLQSEKCPKINQFYFNGAEQLFGHLSDNNDEDRKSDIKLRAISEELSISGNREQIGYSEGTSLSYLLSKKNITSNPLLEGQALYRECCESFSVGEIRFTVITPSKLALEELKFYWEGKLLERRIRPKIISKAYCDAFEQYVKVLQNNVVSYATAIASTEGKSIESLAYVEFEDDNSTTNKSSLSFLIESNNKRLLYLSDCDAGAVLVWLNDLELEKIVVDAVKISHHGSKNNTSLELLNRIVCQKYLISTNGKIHAHPDLEVLARIAIVNKEFGAEIFMNYEVDHIPGWFMSELEKEYPKIKLSMDSFEVYL